MLTCNSNRLPIRSTTRAFFQIDMVPCVFLVWPRYLGNANWYLRDCTQIVNQTIDLCECFSKGLRMTCCISQCSLGLYFADSDTGIYSKGVSDMRAFCVIVSAPLVYILLTPIPASILTAFATWALFAFPARLFTTFNFANIRLRTVVFP